MDRDRESQRREALAAAWPLFGLAVRTPRLELRYPTDDDLLGLLEVIGDIHDPAFLPFLTPWSLVPAPDLQRNSLRHFWEGRSALRPESWSLPLVVVVRGEVLGVQGVGATDFAIRRTVSSGSWLHRPRHGEGIGTEMRAAMLHLAFEGMGADRAETGAFEGNESSLAVTRKLGYRPTGDQVVAVDGRRRRELTFVLDREAWARRRRDDIAIVGLDPCRAMLGLPT